MMIRNKQRLVRILPVGYSRLALLWILLFLYPDSTFSQNEMPSAQPNSSTLDYVTVERIFITGNKRTKDDIILRELDFRIGDTLLLSELIDRLNINQLFLMNTGLFTAARFSFREWEGTTNKVGLQLEVLESWYVYPFPILELADRNFNVWWQTYNHSLRRLNLGVRFYHTNITGRRDLLKSVIQFGFTKKLELIYTLPAFNRSKTLGFNFNILHTREKEIGFNTVDNDLLFHRNDTDVLLKRFRLGSGLLFRPRQYTVHELGITYHNNHIHESVRQELNPDFFLQGLRQRYLSAFYNYTYDRRDIRPYPMRGFLIAANVTKNGLGFTDDFRALNITVEGQQFFTLGPKWSTGLKIKAKTGLQREKQPYYGSQALGYFEDFIRGYEFYVIDGLDYIYHKGVLRYELLNKRINWGKYMKLDSYKDMPFRLFLVFHNELGYVNNPFYRENNPLSNELLWGTGVGLDIVLYYDKIFNIEYSRNHLGERGFFLHWTFNF